MIRKFFLFGVTFFLGFNVALHAAEVYPVKFVDELSSRASKSSFQLSGLDRLIQFEPDRENYARTCKVVGYGGPKFPVLGRSQQFGGVVTAAGFGIYRVDSLTECIEMARQRLGITVSSPNGGSYRVISREVSYEYLERDAAERVQVIGSLEFKVTR